MTDRDRLIELFNAIDKDPAITCPAYKTDKTCEDCKYTINESMCNYIERKADYLLANDVVKVVRCKDCEFVKPTKIKLNGKDLRTCSLYKRPCYDDGFCSRGVLKEREGK